MSSSSPRKISVRFLSATNEDLQAMIKEDKFRADLWQKLCETKISLPAPESSKRDP